MNFLPEQLKGSRAHTSRRSFLAFVGAMMAAVSQLLRRPHLSWAAAHQSESSVVRALTPGAEDLHDLFKDEIRANFKDNVYATLGNSLQLDGESYVKVSQALATYDFLDIIQLASIPEDSRQKLMKNQISRTESGLLAAFASLDWPKFYVELESPRVDISGPSNLRLYAHTGQPLLFVFHNSGISPQSVRAASAEISFPIVRLEIQPGQTRYLRGTVNPRDEGDSEIKISFTTDTGLRDLIVKANVEKTIILEGLLVADATDQESPIARVRVTNDQGKYFPPEAQPSGLIRIITQGRTTRGERWSYAIGKFQVRIPFGKYHVSIRRGLEYGSLDRGDRSQRGWQPPKNVRPVPLGEHGERRMVPRGHACSHA